ncbi:uncharacterized protein LOC122312625 [Carya illinoinensis]|uniref:uncharacterized protein LOC122312625 n=1 Tax=Carya illinoinensis TaxID=32201 RepID=UPI001C71D7DC|nr:uncharacterized protein LOC122312625 [Carya illinoinensis]
MSSATNLNTQPLSSTENPLVVFNITTQVNEKLTHFTFPQWRAQFEALLIGYDLMDYVSGVSLCPSTDGTPLSISRKTHWVRQDKLILSAILASTSISITPLIATTKTSHEAWKKLTSMYASRSCTRAMQLGEELTLIQRGNRLVLDYFHDVKALADEIALIDHPISDDDLTLYVFNGLGPDFGEIAAPIQTREKSLAFEELHDLLVEHESYLRHMEATPQQLVAAANFTTRKSGFHGGQSTKGSNKPNGPSRTSSPTCSGNGQQKDQRCNSLSRSNST